MAKPETRQSSLGEIFTRDFVILAMINLSMFFGFQMTTVGIPVYMAQLGASAQIVGLAATLLTVTATAMRIFAGPTLDRFGRTGLLLGGIAIMACSIFAYAVFPIVGVIMGLRLIQGIGWGAGSTASSTIAADIIPKHRFAEGMGFFAMTNALSSAIAPAVSIQLAQGAGGVYMVYVATAITCLALVLAIAEVALSRRRNGTAMQQAIPTESDGKPSQQPTEPPSGHVTNQGRGYNPAANAPAQTSKFDKVFERRAIVPGLLMLLVNIGFGCITTFIALHAVEQGVVNVTPYFVVYAIITLLSRPLIGKLIDRYGYRIPAILSTLCSAGTLVLIGASGNIAMFGLAGVLAGLGIGTAMSTFQAMAVASVEPWRRGVATSTFMTAFDLGIGIGQFSGGFIAGALGYGAMFFIVAAFPLIASLISFAAIRKGDGARR
jgi:MFS family permease